MTVKVRPYTKNNKHGWEVDIMLTFPGRPTIRERRKAPVGSKSAAKRWGEERERQLIQHYTSTDPDDESRPDLAKKEVPTLARFLPRYMEGHCKANRLRPASIRNREQLFRNHVLPAMGHKRLDRITVEDIQRFKAEREHLEDSTVNLALTFLGTVLRTAEDWGVIDKRVRIKKLREVRKAKAFHDFGDYDRLVLAAEEHGNPSHLLVVLLGGEAGLRTGEMLGLRWSDIDLDRGLLTVARSIYKRQEGPPKGGSPRTIPLAPRLAEALHKYRHLRLKGPEVITSEWGTSPSAQTLAGWLRSLQKRAGIRVKGPHILRHTFCSHLAMHASPSKAIQELAGHQKLSTTEQYMSLSPTTIRDAVEALRRPEGWRHAGDGSSGVVKIQ